MVRRANLWIRSVAVLLGAVLILSACSGSGGGPSGSTPNPTPADTGAQKSEPAGQELKPVTLKWFIMGDKEEETDLVFEEFNRRLPDYLPNTQVEFEVVPAAEYAERWELVAAAGEVIDIAWTGWVHDFAQQVYKGAFQPIDELFEKYGEAMRAEIPAWAYDSTRIDGKLYALPNYKDMFDLRLGLRTPQELADLYWDYERAEQQFMSRKGRAWTLDDYAVLEDYMAKLKEAGKLGAGVSDFIFARVNYGVPVAGHFSYEETDPTFEVKLKFEFEAAKLYYDVLADWFKKGYVRSDVLSNQNRRQDEGKPGGYTLWYHTNYTNQAEIETARFGFPIEVISIEKDWRINPSDPSSAAVIPRTAANPDRAMMLLALLHTKAGAELNNLLVYGIEDRHYKRISDNRVEIPPLEDRKHGLSAFVPGNMFYVWEVQSHMEGYYEYLADIQQNAMVSPLYGFRADLKNFGTEIAHINALVQEYAGLEQGGLSNHEAAYEEFLQKLRNVGADRVKAELQQQVDAFLQEKGISVPAR